MIKLNNRGWGYAMFFFFMGILCIALFMVVHMVNDFELGLSNNRNVSYSQYQRYKRYEREVSSSALSYSKSHGILDQINISKLDVDSDIKSECVGYAIYNYNEAQYVSYLKCGKYQTKGYEK